MSSTRPRRSKAGKLDTSVADTTDADESRSSLRLRSTRSRKRNHDDEENGGGDSDREFERQLQEQEKQQEKEEREKEERRKAKRAAKEAKKKKEEEVEEPEVEHQDFCEVCEQCGELLLCDYCTRAYHLCCVDPPLDEPPEGEWKCPHCEEHGIPEKAETSKVEPERGNDEFCKACREGGNMLCCDTCTNSYHAYCLDPPLTEMPDESVQWSCPQCQVQEPKNKPEKIIAWRWNCSSYPDPVDPEDLLKEGETQETIDPERLNRLHLRPPHKMAPRKERELFVKWKYMSYWHCEWVPEYVYEIQFTHSLRMYWLRNDSNNPPEMEDAPNKHKENDPLQLEQRFYRYDIKPEWLQIHRILNHSMFTKRQYDYLIKWKELVYEQATWESDEMEIPGLQEAIHKYWLHREFMFNEQIPRSIEKKLNAWREAQDMCTLEEERAKRKENNKKHKFDAKKKYDQQPDFITSTGGNLHPYQLEGLNWMRHCWSQGIDAILADEMGLGKTIQALSFLYSLVKEGHSKGPFLVAAPLSTLINWEREAEFWTPDFYVVTYCGDRNSRSVIREHEFSFTEGAVKTGTKLGKMRTEQGIKFHVLLTSYEMINSDKTILSSISWEALVVDEAHRLKNNQSLFFRNLSDYKLKYRLLLTGTPLQNNLEELFHLLNFLSPEQFNDLTTFTHEFSEISKEDQIQKLHTLLGPHMLRRMKSDVLIGMPSKSELIVRVDLSALQKKFYRNVLTRNFEALSVKSGGTQISLLNILMELKKCCNHPYLFAKASLEAPKHPNGIYEGSALIKASGKFVLLQKMLLKLKKGGHRVLIFSQMTKMLDILEDLCENEGYPYERIDGSITGQLRQDAIDRFNAPGAKQFVFLLSTRAGGLGINLATADTVIIYDSDWNPHADIQAFSRAHRIGQKNKVMIYRFVTRNSVEERITTVAKKKMLLTHLVVRAGLGQKGPSMTKNELDDVLRWGTEELFKDEAEGGDDKKADSHAIIWDDENVDALLDRSAGEKAPKETNEGGGGTGERKDWTNEYLSSFKVAQYVTKETDEQEEDEEEKEEEPEQTNKDDSQSGDPDYWEKLLRHHYEHEQEVEAQQFGKGKRIRKQINYASEHMKNNWKDKPDADDDDYEASDIETDDSEDLEGDEDLTGEMMRMGRKSKSQYAAQKTDNEVLPPLLARVNGLIEVLGFNPRQRKAFYTAVMRYGMPTPDSYKSQWLVRDLRMKSEKVFKAYSSLFMRHLCEPATNALEDHFNDGVPREGLNRHIVLTRIGTMALLRRKVQEFERYNGVWSIPEMREKQLSEQLIAMGIVNKDGKKSPKSPRSKEGSVEKDDKDEKSGSPSKEGSVSKDGEEPKPAEKEKSKEPEDQTDADKMAEVVQMDVDEKKDGEEKMEVDSEEKKTVPEIIINSTERYQMPPFKFNITDGGFTELHAIWSAEEEVIKTKEFDYDIWNRRHDYWLMCGFAVHGYLRYNEVLNDPRFALLNEPFKQEQNKANLQEIKHRFLQRRFKLLEQALIVEEQLRRAVNLQYGQKKLENEVENNGTDEAKQNGNESESKEVEMIEEQSTSAAKETPKLDTEKVQTKPARIEALVHANKQVAQEAFAGNRQAGVALQKMLSQLEEILSDMKSDVSRLPATVAHLPSVCQRLEMDERAILNRLTSRDPEAVAGQSSLPSPGPFVTPLMQARFNGIQPKFAAVVNPKRDIQTPSHGAPIVIPLDTDVQKTNDPETAKEVKSADVKPEKLDVGDDVKPEKLDATDDVKLEEVDTEDVVKMEELDASDDVGDVVKMEELDASDDIKPEKLNIEEIPQASKSPDIEELPQTSKSPDIEEIPQTSKSSEPAKSPEPEQLPDLDNSAMETDN